MEHWLRYLKLKNGLLVGQASDQKDNPNYPYKFYLGKFIIARIDVFFVGDLSQVFTKALIYVIEHHIRSVSKIGIYVLEHE